MIAVLDTNVLVSGMINPSGPPGRIVDLLRAGTLRCAVDDRILAEYGDVLARPQLARYFTASEVTAILDHLYADSEHVLATVQVTGLPDASDAPFLEVALAAELVLVTGNVKHFPPRQRRGGDVVTPAEFVRERVPPAG